MTIRRYLSVFLLLLVLITIPLGAAPAERAGMRDPETAMTRAWRVIQKLIRVVQYGDALIIPIP